ncbi:2-amino-4-hydroxy-6-hydroxymethyldihydropteridine diphosphokinase [Enemella sp. A6]|uniref:2-amino-4-hydroxy-6- hydroxymethyldihydropteridine diphosphokinase n=1 Tax=Enemella sp. A6 TaxID=3440152 RepID=UPI003EB705D5
MTSPNPYAIDVDTLSGMKPLSKLVVAIGSNLGDRLAAISGAVNALRDTPDVIIVDVSPIYETKAVGGPSDSPDFLNLVVVAETTQDPRTLLERAHAIEDAFGRTRDLPNGPRTLDLDLIMVGRQTLDDEELTLPHPRAHERAFVLAPWNDIDPGAEIEGRGKVADLLEAVGRDGITRRDDLHLED